MDYRDRVEERGQIKVRSLSTATFLSEYNVESVSVPVSFPTGTAEQIAEQGIDVLPDHEGTVDNIRAVKTDEEIDHLAEIRRVYEKAMTVADEMLECATIEDSVVTLTGMP